MKTFLTYNLKVLLTMVFLAIGSLSFAQFSTIADGSWTNATIWDANGIPPNPIPVGTTVDINHAVIIASPTIIENDGTIRINGSDATRLLVISGAELINRNQLFTTDYAATATNNILEATGSGKLTNSGTVTVTASSPSGRIRFRGNLDNLAGGLFEYQDVAQFFTVTNALGATIRSGTGFIQGQVLTAFENDGLFDQRGGNFSPRNGAIFNNNATGVITLGSNVRFNVGFFTSTLNNFGTINNNGGVLLISPIGFPGNTPTAEVFTSTGIVNGNGVVAGGNDGVIDLSATSLANTVKLYGGTIAAPAFSSFAQPNTLLVTGTLTNFGGIISFLEGTVAGDFSVIDVDGSTNLTGTTLEIRKGFSFTPALGDEFEILKASGGVTGTFASVDASNATLGAGLEWEVVYEANRVLLKVAALPVVPGAALQGTGGYNQLVRVNDDPSLDLECEMTLEGWVKLTSPYVWGAILLKAAGNSWSNGYGLYANYNQIVFMPRGFGQQHYSGYNLPLNTWTHVACTYDGATSKIYINGNLVSTQSISGDIPQNNYPLGIGGDAGYPWYTFRGAIDEVRVWSQVLEQSDIQAGMNCEIQTTSDCLVANYHFNQGTAGGNNFGETTLYDDSAYGNNGILGSYALNGTSSNWVAPGGVTSGVACSSSFYCDPNFACCEGPEAICQNNTVYIQPNGYAVVTPADVDGGSTAECGLQSMTVYPNTFDCDDIGWQYVTLTVTDTKGESDNCGAWVYIDKGDALPGNMSNANIGGATGSAGYDPCEEELCIVSNGITFPNADKIHMAYEYLCSNSSMVVEARILSVGPNHGLGGIMIRESLSAGAKKVALKTQLGNFLQRDTRTTTNGFAQTQQIFRPGVNWLKIMRNGNQFIMYTRTDNTNWQFAAFAIVNMSSCVYIGLFTEGVNDNVSTTACFDNVSISGGGNYLAESNQGLETEEVRFGQDFEAFPNPASSIINVRLQEMDTDAQLMIQDQLGRTIWTEEIQAGQVSTSINVSDSQYQNGIYYLTLLSNGNTSTQKIVITK